MATFRDSFESGNLSQWSVIDSTISVSTLQAFRGLNSARVNGTTVTGFVRYDLAATNFTTPGYQRVYFRIASASIGVTPVQILRFSDVANAQVGSIRINSSRQLELYKADNTVLGSPTAALNLDQWYCIELSITAPSNPGTLEARLDGVVFASGNNSSQGSWGRVLVGAVTPAATVDFYFDEYKFSFTGYPGLLPAVGSKDISLNNGGSGKDISLSAVSSDVSVNVFDTISITETQTSEVSNFLVTQDVLTLTENISLILIFDDFVVSVEDNLAVSEFTQLDTTFFVSINETLSINEDVVSSISTVIDVFETFTIVEIQTTELFSFIVTEDVVSILENVNQSLVIDTFTVSIDDVVSLSESAQFDVTSFLFIQDTLTVSESTLTNVVLLVDVFDALGVNEDNTNDVTTYLSLFDSVVITENSSALVTFENSVNETTAISEVVLLLYSTEINSTDFITVSESVFTELTIYQNVSDIITLTENVTVSLQASQTVSSEDTLPILESVSVVLFTECDLLLENGSPLLDENGEPISLEVCSIGGSDLVVVETLSLTESVFFNIAYEQSLVDTVTLSEVVFVQNIIQLFVFENISVTENQSLLRDTIVFSIDNLSLNEFIDQQRETFDIDLLIIDSILIEESNQNNLVLNISVFSALACFENITNNVTIQEFFVDVFEIIAIDENTLRSVDRTLFVHDVMVADEQVERVVFFLLTVIEPISVVPFFAGGDKYNVSARGPRGIPTGGLRPIKPSQNYNRVQIRGSVDSR